MSLKYLLQDKYKNDNGHDIEASAIDCLAPYKHECDGFYNWECGLCHHSHFSRSCGWPISGQVLKCDSCSKMNLLVRTNCIDLDALMQRNFDSEYDKKELERLRGIEKYNEAEIAKIRRGIIEKVQNAF